MLACLPFKWVMHKMDPSPPLLPLNPIPNSTSYYLSSHLSALADPMEGNWGGMRLEVCVCIIYYLGGKKLFQVLLQSTQVKRAVLKLSYQNVWYHCIFPFKKTAINSRGFPSEEMRLRLTIKVMGKVTKIGKNIQI